MVRTLSTMDSPRFGVSPVGQFPRPYQRFGYASTTSTISTSTSAAEQATDRRVPREGEEKEENDDSTREHQSVTDLRRFAEGDQVIGTREGFDDTPLAYPLPPERLEGGSATD